MALNRGDVIEYLSNLSPSNMEDLMDSVREQKFENVHNLEYPDWLKGHENHRVFYRDMALLMVDLGIDPEGGDEDECDSDEYMSLRHYRGRFFYDGPGVVCSQEMLSKVMAATNVPLRQDNMGYDVVVYPG